jgi:hypothetical protein
MGHVDITLLRMAQDRGYPVAVVTANEVGYVARTLQDLGIDAVADPTMKMASWQSWQARGRVLVTNRKIAGRAFVDDRAIHWQYGDDPLEVFQELDKREIERARARENRRSRA